MKNEAGTGQVDEFEARSLTEIQTDIDGLVARRIRLRDVVKLPQLLVSVRSAHEADIAIAGGAEILDVKEPSRGSLGMASVEEISSIAQRIHLAAPAIPLSVAAGELIDWLNGAEVPAMPTGMTFAKMGLSRARGSTSWKDDWKQVREEFDQRASSKLKWVAVAYSDSTNADSPDLNDVIAAAIETGCAGLLVDTWIKDGRTLLDGLTANSINDAARELHEAGLFLAVAGQITLGLLPRLRQLSADIVAIRSAGCTDNQRTSEVDQSRIAHFHHELRSVYLEKTSKQSRPCTTAR